MSGFWLSTDNSSQIDHLGTELLNTVVMVRVLFWHFLSTTRLYSAEASKSKPEARQGIACFPRILERGDYRPRAAPHSDRQANRFRRFTKRSGFDQAADSHEGPNRRNECWEGVSSGTGLGAQSKTPRDLIDRRAIGRGVEIWRESLEGTERSRAPDRAKRGLGRSDWKLARILECPSEAMRGTNLGGPA
jgi:hypothetical protein